MPPVGKSTGKPNPTARRLDDFKQFWYFYYLLDTGKAVKTSPEMQEFMWKGQMSYISAMYMVGRVGMDGPNLSALDLIKATNPKLADGPAHYTHEETQAWWRKVMEHWPVIPVQSFSDATLANGKKGKDVDLNDLVLVDEFREPAVDAPFLYNSAGDYGVPTFMGLAQQAGDEVGFKLFWPADLTRQDSSQMARDLPYGIDV